jgi:hypothetical protein
MQFGTRGIVDDDDFFPATDGLDHDLFDRLFCAWLEECRDIEFDGHEPGVGCTRESRVSTKGADSGRRIDVKGDLACRMGSENCSQQDR